VVRKFSWDPAKAEANYRKHGIRFDEAELVFHDPHAIIIDDPLHSIDEDRYAAIGETFLDRTLFVSYTIRDDQPWLISARKANRAEKRRYMRGDRIRDRGEDSDEGINFDDIPEMTEADFARGVRGLHYTPNMSMHRVSIANDLLPYFGEDDDLNAALRQLIKEGRTPQNIPTRPFQPAWIQRANLDDDVARVFNDDVSVNSALRMLIDEGRAPKR
jgi:uncharacterized protein